MALEEGADDQDDREGGAEVLEDEVLDHGELPRLEQDLAVVRDHVREPLLDGLGLHEDSLLVERHGLGVALEPGLGHPVRALEGLLPLVHLGKVWAHHLDESTGAKDVATHGERVGVRPSVRREPLRVEQHVHDAGDHLASALGHPAAVLGDVLADDLLRVRHGLVHVGTLVIVHVPEVTVVQPARQPVPPAHLHALGHLGELGLDVAQQQASHEVLPQEAHEGGLLAQEGRAKEAALERGQAVGKGRAGAGQPRELGEAWHRALEEHGENLLGALGALLPALGAIPLPALFGRGLHALVAVVEGGDPEGQGRRPGQRPLPPRGEREEHHERRRRARSLPPS
mmetsp:Transcript_5048/g.18200  ORF Transcript_5048/g.18200 Transcript_5048/m.18200 type:complete len:342 (+) Transcript_5048:3318-4343(+)